MALLETIELNIVGKQNLFSVQRVCISNLNHNNCWEGKKEKHNIGNTGRSLHTYFTENKNTQKLQNSQTPPLLELCLAREVASEQMRRD